MTKGAWLAIGVAVGVGAAGWLALAFEGDKNGMAGMRALVRSRFPNVRQVTPAEAAAWLGSTNASPPQLLDVRTEAEYRISHLAGARRVDPGIETKDLLGRIDRKRPVLVYCAVGYRSSELAARLMEAGVTNVANLEGSIFAWANEGRPLEADGRAASRVHPYNRKFAGLLKPECRAEAEDLP